MLGLLPPRSHRPLPLSLSLAFALLALSFSPEAEACSFKCRFNQDCYECVHGGRYSNCFLDCDVCGGERCIAGGASAAPGFLEPEPLRELERVPSQLLAEHLGAPVGRVFEWLSQWYDNAPKKTRTRIELEGSVAIDRKPFDFVLAIEQHGPTQVYCLHISSVGTLVLRVPPMIEGRREIAFELNPASGGQPSAGSFMSAEK